MEKKKEKKIEKKHFLPRNIQFLLDNIAYSISVLKIDHNYWLDKGSDSSTKSFAMLVFMSNKKKM